VPRAAVLGFFGLLTVRGVAFVELAVAEGAAGIRRNHPTVDCLRRAILFRDGPIDAEPKGED
jgi:hypothetical protein